MNVSKLALRPHVTAGCGGFVDITARARKMVFSGYFRAGGSNDGTRGAEVVVAGKRCPVAGRISMGNKADVDKAVAAARKAFDVGHLLPARHDVHRDVAEARFGQRRPGAPRVRYSSIVVILYHRLRSRYSNKIAPVRKGKARLVSAST